MDWKNILKNVINLKNINIILSILLIILCCYNGEKFITIGGWICCFLAEIDSAVLSNKLKKEEENE